MKLRFPVRMLVVDRSPAEAATLVAGLRRAKYTVSPTLVGDLSGVNKALQTTSWDLLLIGHNLVAAPLAKVMEARAQAHSDVPVIVLEEPGGAAREARLMALRAGVHDVVERDEPEMLEHTVRRELQALEDRRRLQRYRRAQSNEEQSLTWLVEHSRKRLAIVQRGDLLVANAGFLDLFGIETFKPPIRDGLYACIADADRAEFRAFLEGTWSSNDRQVEIELRGANSTAGEFDLTLHIAPIAFHDDIGHRVVASESAAEVAVQQPKPEPARVTDISSTQPPQPEITEPRRATPNLSVINGPNQTANSSAADVEPIHHPHRGPDTRNDSDHNRVKGDQVDPTPSPDVGDAPAHATPPQPTLVPAAATTDVAEHEQIDRSSMLLRIMETVGEMATSGRYAGVAYVELDNFSDLKAHLGLTHIDGLISAVLAQLRALAPPGAALAHIADDDFVVLLSTPDEATAVTAFRRLEAGISGVLLEIDDRIVLVSAGVGLAALEHDDIDPMAILDRAYAACRSEIHITSGAEPESSEAELEALNESALEIELADFTQAMTDGRMWLVFQPIVRLQGESIELYEVFTRYRNNASEMVAPGEFLELTDRAGIRSQFYLWVIEQALDVLASQHAEGHRTRLIVKASDHSLRDVRIPLAIGRRLKSLGIPAERLIVEVCERVATAQVKSTRTLMHALRGLHCATAIEHFGISRKPFALLKHIPVDFLTIDPSIANNVASDPAVRERIRTIVRQAGLMNKLTIAEYVEETRNIGFLYEAGVDFVQGYHIQPPGPALDFQFSMVV